MNATQILATASVVGVATAAVKIRENIIRRNKDAKHQHAFQIGWKTFLAVHHATDDYDLAMRVANEVQAQFSPYTK